MATDLIQRAARRIVQERGLSLVQDAAAPRPAEAAPEPIPSVEAVPWANRDVLPPVFAAAPPPAAPNTVELPRPKPRSSRSITLDMARLSRSGIMTPDSSLNRMAEEFRIIKRPLLLNAFSDEQQPSNSNRLIMVTSARPGEGKTFVALNLAMSIASERNRHVLLIDADVQHSTIPQVLGIDVEKGLLDILEDRESDLSEVMVRTNYENLSIIPAGRGQPQATELLASPRMADLVQEIATRYDDRVVIFDASPILVSSEPGVLALHVGQTVLVVQAESTGRRAVDEAIGLLGGRSRVSIVLNRTRAWLGMEQFGSYSRSGSA
jgi:receptor protein-tyrosine kinase